MFNSLRPATIGGTKTTRTTRTAAVAAAALSLGMAAFPLATAPAASAAATGTLGPCTVTAEKPYHTGKFTLSGKKLIAYPIKASCTRSDVKVIIKQIILEDDPDIPFVSSNDVQKDWYTPAGTPLYFSTPGTKKVSPVPEYRLTRTLDDKWGAEEVFHRVKFWVYSNGVTQGPKEVTSANTSIHP